MGVGALNEASNATLNGAGPLVGVATKFAVGSRLVNVPVWIVSGRGFPVASSTATHTFVPVTLVACPQLNAEG